MKKKFRFLSLILSMMLLAATAFPASAEGTTILYPPHSQYEYPGATATTGTASSVVPIRSSAVWTTPLALDNAYYFSIYGASGSHYEGDETDVYIELSGGEVAYTGSGEFCPGTYHDLLVEAGENAKVAHRVENPAETISHQISPYVPRTEYQLFAWCYFGSVYAENYDELGYLVFSQEIDYMPYMDGVFYILDY